MNLSPNYASSFALGAVIAATLVASPSVQAGEYIETTSTVRPAASRCAGFGPGFVDVGNGTCARVSGHIRVEFGVRQAGNEAWAASGGASSATLRSDGDEMMPGVGASHQLRVRNALQTVSPY